MRRTENSKDIQKRWRANLLKCTRKSPLYSAHITQKLPIFESPQKKRPADFVAHSWIVSSATKISTHRIVPISGLQGQENVATGAQYYLVDSWRGRILPSVIQALTANARSEIKVLNNPVTLFYRAGQIADPRSRRKKLGPLFQPISTFQSRTFEVGATSSG